MKKLYFFVVIILLSSGCAQKEIKNLTPTKTIVQKENFENVKINSQEIKVEIADTAEEQYQGLSFRKSLCADCGMLFKFKEKSEKTFVMRNMNFPLDIIFIDENKIIKIEKNLKPEGESPKKLYLSGEPVNYVLEVNGGYADKFGIKTGDKIIYSLK